MRRCTFGAVQPLWTKTAASVLRCVPWRPIVCPATAFRTLVSKDPELQAMKARSEALLAPEVRPRRRQRGSGARRRAATATTGFTAGTSETAKALGLLGRPDEAVQATVYNPFIGRVVKTTSAQVQALAMLGVTPVAGAMRVTQPAVLNNFATDVRARRASLPTSWSHRMRERVGGLLLDPTVADPAAAVATLLQDLDRSRDVARATIGMIGDATEEEVAIELEAAANLNVGQKRIMHLAERGYPLYIGGHAGTGKTVLLRAIRGSLKRMGLAVGTTATTGLAAAHLGGVTFHSFMGINRHDEIGGSGHLNSIDVLIIDEVSMMDRAMFEEFDRALRKLRGRPTALFGGVQVILCGDFLQLEPIRGTDRTPDGRPMQPQLIFDSPLFMDHVVHVALTEQVRQAGHEAFAAGLQALRRGVWPAAFFDMVQMVSHDINLVEAALSPIHTNGSGSDPQKRKDGDEMASEQAEESSTPTKEHQSRPILLLARNRDVRIANEARMAELKSEEVTFLPCLQSPSVSGHWTSSALLQPARPDDGDGGVVNFVFDVEAFRGRVLRHLQHALEEVDPRRSILTLLHVVMYPLLDGFVLRLRLPTGLDEASRASVRGHFDHMVKNHIVDLSGSRLAVIDVRDSAEGLQSPAIDEALTRSLDAHPVAQRLTLKEGCEVMLRSNLTSKLINGSVGTVVGFVEASVDNVPRVLQKVKHLMAAIEVYIVQQRFLHGVDVPLMPVVQFKGEQQPVPVPPVAIVVGGDALTSYYEVAALCIPLVQAYAFTIHKVQGMTLLGDVHIALGKLWQCNHIVYVALSRVRRPEQLMLSGFRASLVTVNHDAVTFDALVPDSKAPFDDILAGRELPIADWALSSDDDPRSLETRSMDMVDRATALQFDAPARKNHSHAALSVVRPTSQESHDDDDGDVVYEETPWGADTSE